MALDRNLAERIGQFFIETLTKSVRDNSTNFAETHDPSEARYRALFNSLPFLAEPESRAKTDASTAIKNIVGLVAIGTDTQVKAGTSGIGTDKTLVPHTGQLPVVASETRNYGTGLFNGETIEITVDATVTTRNQFNARLTQAFVQWVSDQISNASTGETNTASNIGGEVELFAQKVSSDLQFRTIRSLVNYLTVTQNNSNNTVDISFNASQFITDNNLTPTPLNTVSSTVDVDPTTTLNFNADQFNITDAGSGVANVTLDNRVINIPTWQIYDRNLLEFIVISGDTGTAISPIGLTTAGNVVNYYITGNVIHFSFKLDFQLRSTPAVSQTTAIQLRFRPPSGRTFALNNDGGSCRFGANGISGVRNSFFSGIGYRMYITKVFIISTQLTDVVVEGQFSTEIA